MTFVWSCDVLFGFLLGSLSASLQWALPVQNRASLILSHFFHFSLSTSFFADLLFLRPFVRPTRRSIRLWHLYEMRAEKKNIELWSSIQACYLVSNQQFRHTCSFVRLFRRLQCSKIAKTFNKRGREVINIRDYVRMSFLFSFFVIHMLAFSYFLYFFALAFRRMCLFGQRPR